MSASAAHVTLQWCQEWDCLADTGKHTTADEPRDEIASEAGANGNGTTTLHIDHNGWFEMCKSSRLANKSFPEL